ncbi:MAG: dTMP kinase [Clostridia bacterium]|nr:dTMP kinase [Clostridia bacterium]
MKGKFITFEGCEGSGKSTHVALFKEYLDRNGIDYIFLREPGGVSISEKIRSIILDVENKEMCDRAEALLYAAARAQLITEKIIPALNEGKLVVVDRYIDSSFAYQGYARGLGIDFIEKINSYAIDSCMPDKTVFLDISPKVAFERKGGADKDDRLELSGIEFHERVYEGYKKLVEKYPERFISIDPTGTKAETHAKIIESIKDILG